jgi:hypothetical protein
MFRAFSFVTLLVASIQSGSPDDRRLRSSSCNVAAGALVTVAVTLRFLVFAFALSGSALVLAGIARSGDFIAAVGFATMNAPSIKSGAA